MRSTSTGGNPVPRRVASGSSERRPARAARASVPATGRSAEASASTALARRRDVPPRTVPNPSGVAPGARRPHDSCMKVTFPAESPEYRRARDALLEQEIALRRQTEAVAALRRALPPGGLVPEDYVFDGIDE